MSSPVSSSANRTELPGSLLLTQLQEMEVCLQTLQRCFIERQDALIKLNLRLLRVGTSLTCLRFTQTLRRDDLFKLRQSVADKLDATGSEEAQNKV